MLLFQKERGGDMYMYTDSCTYISAKRKSRRVNKNTKCLHFVYVKFGTGDRDKIVNPYNNLLYSIIDFDNLQVLYTKTNKILSKKYRHTYTENNSRIYCQGLGILSKL